MSSAVDSNIKDETLSTLFLKSEINTDFMDTRIGSARTQGGVVIEKDLWVLGDVQVDGTINIPSNSNATQLQGVDISAVAPTGNQILQYLAGPNEWTPVSNLTLPGDLIVTGDATIQGTTTIIESVDLQIEDNIILLNRGEAGAGVSLGLSGIEIDRGTEINWQIVYDESSGALMSGTTGSLEPVALRELAPVDTAIPFWNQANLRFETEADMTWNAGTNTLSATNVSIGNDLTVTNNANLCNIVCTGANFSVSVPGTHGIVMGTTNTTTAATATVSGGTGNTASQVAATVSGGDTNTASGNYATVPGGLSNTAAGMYAFAAGRSSSANFNNAFAMGYNATGAHTGAFVWSDGAGIATSSAAANQGTFRTSGGFRIITDTNVSPVQGLKMDASGSRWEQLDNSLMEANAIELQGRDVASTAPTNSQVLTWNDGLSQWEPQDSSGGGGAGGVWATFSFSAGTNVSTIDTQRDVRSTELGSAILIAFDVRVSPSGSVSFIELDDLPVAAASVIGSAFGNSLIMSRVSDGVLSVVNATVDHASTSLRLTSVFTAGESYDVTGQFYYAADPSLWVTFTPTAGTNVGVLVVRDARYVQLDEVLMVTMDVRVTPTGAVSQIGLNSMPFAADSVVGASFGNAVVISRVSDGALTPANLKIVHGASAVTIDSVFTAVAYDVTMQLYYKA